MAPLNPLRGTWTPLTIFIVLHVILRHASIASAEYCISCSWSGVEHPSKVCANADVSVVDETAKPYVNVVNCGDQNCIIRRVINADGKIHSILRGCSTKAPQKTKCSADTYFNTCETICRGDKICNKKGESLPARAPPKAPASRPVNKKPGGNGAAKSGHDQTTTLLAVAAAVVFNWNRWLI